MIGVTNGKKQTNLPDILTTDPFDFQSIEGATSQIMAEMDTSR